jgi:hypothetical protein
MGTIRHLSLTTLSTTSNTTGTGSEIDGPRGTRGSTRGSTRTLLGGKHKQFHYYGLEVLTVTSAQYLRAVNEAGAPDVNPGREGDPRVWGVPVKRPFVHVTRLLVVILFIVPVEVVQYITCWCFSSSIVPERSYMPPLNFCVWLCMRLMVLAFFSLFALFCTTYRLRLRLLVCFSR